MEGQDPVRKQSAAVGKCEFEFRPTPGSQCDTGGVDCILSFLKPWEADLFLLGWGLDRTVQAGHKGKLVPSHHCPLIVPAPLPRFYLLCDLHRPPVHKILDDQYPICNLVVPGSRHTTARRQAECFHKALYLMEVPEGLFPHLGEYGAD